VAHGTDDACGLDAELAGWEHCGQRGNRTSGERLESVRSRATPLI
jgi:hypothetical protein